MTNPSAEQITALAALIASVGAIVTAVLQFLQRGKLSATHDIATDTNAKLETGNGSTVGQNSATAATVAKALAATNGVDVPEAPSADPHA